MNRSQNLQNESKQNQKEGQSPAANAGVRDFPALLRRLAPMIVYLILYLIWFFYLERTVTGNYTIIHTRADDLIPFCEVFVIPYMLWFGYVSLTVLYFCITDKEEYLRISILLVIGMTTFLIISTLFPNGHDLRPAELSGNNLFTRVLARLWKTDPPTSLWPSIHVYDALGAHFAIARSRRFNRKANPRSPVRIASCILCVSIILSTMFIKQHSVFDVATGILMGGIMYTLIYRHDLIGAFRTWHNNKPRPQLP